MGILFVRSLTLRCPVYALIRDDEIAQHLLDLAELQQSDLEFPPRMRVWKRRKNGTMAAAQFNRSTAASWS